MPLKEHSLLTYLNSVQEAYDLGFIDTKVRDQIIVLGKKHATNIIELQHEIYHYLSLVPEFAAGLSFAHLSNVDIPPYNQIIDLTNAYIISSGSDQYEQEFFNNLRTQYVIGLSTNNIDLICRSYNRLIDRLALTEKISKDEAVKFKSWDKSTLITSNNHSTDFDYDYMKRALFDSIFPKYRDDILNIPTNQEFSEFFIQNIKDQYMEVHEISQSQHRDYLIELFRKVKLPADLKAMLPDLSEEDDVSERVEDTTYSSSDVSTNAAICFPHQQSSDLWHDGVQ